MLMGLLWWGRASNTCMEMAPTSAARLQAGAEPWPLLACSPRVRLCGSPTHLPIVHACLIGCCTHRCSLPSLFLPCQGTVPERLSAAGGVNDSLVNAYRSLLNGGWQRVLAVVNYQPRKSLLCLAVVSCQS